MSNAAGTTLRLVVITTVPETLAAFFPSQLRALAQEGFEVHAVSSPGLDLVEIGKIPGVTVHAIPMERKPHPVRDLVSLFRLFALMRKLRPHIVHTHTPKAGLLGMAAARAMGVPVRLYTVHGLPLLTRIGKWRKVLESAERASAALASKTYSVSASVRDLVVDLKLCPSSKIDLLGDGSCAGVNLTRFNPATLRSSGTAFREKLSIPSGALLLSYVGRLARDKGIEVLAEAWLIIAHQFPNIHLLLAGPVDHTDPVSESALAALRTHARVHMPGAQPPQAITSIYAATDIFVLPTFREGLSQVALEAGAMGVPIVSCRVSGLDAVQHGITGLLVPPRDPIALAEAIARLASNPEFRDTVGRAAMGHIQARYSEQRVNQLWMDEYRKLVEESLPKVAAMASRMESHP